MKSHVNPFSSSDAGSTDDVELPEITKVLGASVTIPASPNTSSTPIPKADSTDKADSADFTVKSPASTETADSPCFTVNSPPNVVPHGKQKLVDKMSKTRRSSDSSFTVLELNAQEKLRKGLRTRRSCTLPKSVKGNQSFDWSLTFLFTDLDITLRFSLTLFE